MWHLHDPSNPIDCNPVPEINCVNNKRDFSKPHSVGKVLLFVKMKIFL